MSITADATTPVHSHQLVERLTTFAENIFAVFVYNRGKFSAVQKVQTLRIHFWV